MFRENTKHLQSNLFGVVNRVSKSLQKKIDKSAETTFYRLIFSRIDERLFEGLYSEETSRPNAAINAMVSALILMKLRNWTYEELFENMQFHVLVRIALGLNDLETMPFCMATLFNFQNRLNDHFIKTGENLFEQVFDGLTAQQLKELKVKANICRTDSLMVASNIRFYSRLQLLVELILRIYRVLTDSDQALYRHQFERYLGKSSGQYIYALKSVDLESELLKVGELYHWIDRQIKPLYAEQQVFQVFERVYQEHFTILSDRVQVRPPAELHSSCVQSPDDLDAAYREKNGLQIKGHVISVVETAMPENEINLITDVVLTPANTDDSTILNKRLDNIKEKTPEIEELHFDGGYGSESNDEKMQKEEITAVQTAIRGRESRQEISIERDASGDFEVYCPLQRVKAEPTRKRFKACFDEKICRTCEHYTTCRLISQKKGRVYYFRAADYLKQRRQRSLEQIPPERRSIRNNVEATIKEFACRMPGRKVRVRGCFKTELFMYGVAIGVNFGRIYRHLKTKDGVDLHYLSRITCLYAKTSGLLQNLIDYAGHWMLNRYYRLNIMRFKIYGF